MAIYYKRFYDLRNALKNAFELILWREHFELKSLTTKRREEIAHIIVLSVKTADAI